ncbi:MAG: efflux RND transporter periplasmic adaptor subunit [Gammaproteobacteria bacterium]
MRKTVPTLTAVLVLLCLSACETETVQHEEESHRLLVTRPVQRETTITREYVCQIHSSRHIDVRAMAHGYLQQVAVQEGQKLEQGQLMFKILPVVYQAELKRAQAEAEAARVEYENTANLARNKVVSDTELALAQAHYEKAKAELDLARAHLGFTEIRAPFNGLMDRLHVREGSLVEAGELLTTMSDNSTMWVYFNVPEAEYLAYVERSRGDGDDTVKLQLANGQRFEHSGTIATIEADFNNQTGTIPFRADFPNPERILRHGQTGNILMETKLPNALVIPQKATFEILEHKYVFVVGEDHAVKQVPIEIAYELEDVFVVGEGIEESDMILLEGLRQVHEGEKIEYEFEDPETTLAQLKLPAE